MVWQEEASSNEAVSEDRRSRKEPGTQVILQGTIIPTSSSEAVPKAWRSRQEHRYFILEVLTSY